MAFANEYRRQFQWRAWSSVLDALPDLAGRVVLDLGCGVGDQAEMLVARGARVVGIDLNEELLAAARSKRLANAEFRTGDLRMLPDCRDRFDGIWCSFATAYCPDLPVRLEDWKRQLQQGGWIALTEIDDLFAHEPLDARSKALLDAYVRESIEAGRYDFRMGRKLSGHLERAGFTVSRMLMLPDRELAFDGPSEADVLEAWKSRFERMALLRDFCGPEFEHVRTTFLHALTLPGHRSLARVICCIAIK